MTKEESSASLTTFVATRRQRWIAGSVASFVVVVAILTSVHARAPWPVEPAFLPSYISMVFTTDGITAFLLWRQSMVGRAASLAMLGTAYAFSALTAVALLLAFPGIFGATGLFGAGSQTSVYLWAIWHAGWPAVVIASILLLARERRSRPAPVAVLVRGLTVSVLTLLAAVAAIAFVTYRFGDRLPPLVVKGDYHVLISSGLGPAIVVLHVAALATLARITRLRSVAHLWLAVAVVASLCEVVVTQVGGARYSIGWYIARLDALVAASVVLGALLHEAGRLGTVVANGQRRLRAIVDGVADALLTITHDGHITSVNPAAEALFGVEGDAALGATIETFVPDYAARSRAFRGSVAIEAHGRHHNGRSFPIELAFGGETDSGRIVIIRDITQRRRAEDLIREARDRALEAAAVKSTFLATMSHEIRTPINAIVGMSELLLQTPLDAEGREYAATVRDSAGALLAVINDILDFSKIEAGKLEIDAIPFSILQTVESACDIIAALARAKGLSLSTYVAPDVPARTIGDPDRLRQILLNLLGNAVKFTERGSVTIRATVDRAEGERSFVRIEVADTGVGISESALARLFQPFHQADASTHRRFGGTGLGLSISKRLVELMGGEIGALSRPGEGSTFHLTVPLLRVEAERADDTTAALHGARVLLEPEPVARQIVAQYLLSWGAIAIPATNIAHVLEMLRGARTRGARFEVVVTAEEALLARVRADELVADTPVIVLSASDEPGLAAEAAARGAVAFIRKPLHHDALHAALLAARGGPAVAAAAPVRRDAAPVWGERVPHVLVADDNPVNRKVAIRQLERLGVRVETADDGRAAVEAVSRTPYDLVLMDCQMPELDGFEATRAIRAAEHAGTRVPIIAMTANALEGDREACLAAGMDDYLSKPVQLAELRAALERHVGGTPVAR